MTANNFIKKWLGNQDYQYTEQNCDLMLKDLQKVVNREKLVYQLFIGKVSEVIGYNKTVELLMESKDALR